jgi:polyhydroxyalkanoate synthesis regulator phasin
MPQPPDWKRVLETGMNFTEVHRSQAQKIASDLVSQGQLARDQLGAAVDEIVDTSRRRSEELRKVVRAEVKRQLETLHLAGVVPFDLDDEEPKLRTGSASKSPAKKSTAKQAAKPAKKQATKKAANKPAKKAAKKAGKTAAKQATKKPAKKPAKTAQQAATKKNAAKKTPAQKAAAPAARAR